MSFIAKLCRKWSTGMTHHPIPDRDNPDEIYLSRYYETDSQQDAWWFLHNIKLPNYEPCPHNHPYSWQLSLILAASYTEETYDPVTNTTKVRRRRFFNWIPSTKYHRIIEFHGECWTIFIHGPKTGKSWGFWVPGVGHVHNSQLQWVKEKLEQEYWEKVLAPSRYTGFIPGGDLVYV